MKKISIILIIGILSSMLTTKASAAGSINVTTKNIVSSNVAVNSATLEGQAQVSFSGLSGASLSGTITAWFLYDTNQADVSSGNAPGSTVSTYHNQSSIALNFNKNISGLFQGTTYYYKACASYQYSGNSNTGTDCGSVKSFTTLVLAPIAKPTVTTVAVNSSDTGQIGTALRANVNNPDTTGQLWFEYQKTDLWPNNPTESSKMSIGTGQQNNLFIPITDLLPNTHYSYRAITSNSGGTSLPGAVMSFTTAFIPTPPKPNQAHLL